MAGVLTFLSPSNRLSATLLAWFPILLGVVLLYLPTYGYLAQYTWTQEDHAHGPMILAASLFLVWQRRDELARLIPEPLPLVGWPLLVGGLLLHALGQAMEVIILEVAAQIPILAGVLLLTLGRRAVRLLWFPILFLVFMIPLPGFLVDSLTGSLKQQVSVLAEQLLYLLDYPVARTGVTLTVGQYQLLVADACSGLHSLYSLSAVGLLYIQLMPRQGWLRTAILAAAILPIAFAANVLRVLFLALATYHFGEAASQGLAHDLASPVMFAAAVLSLGALDALLGLGLARLGLAGGKPAAAAPHAPGQMPGVPARAHSWRHALPIGLAILAAIPVATAITPTRKVADQGPKIDLEAMLPKRFGAWTVDESITPLRADPRTTELLNKLYSQTLSRTYINPQGQRIMLSIAYGGDQSESMSVHKPEVCYPAQGFKVVKEGDASLDTGAGVIPVRRLVAVQGRRMEPITYWMTIGDRVAQVKSADWKLEQIKFGLTGRIPDGLLFRVSSITGDEEAAYRSQADFVRALMQSLPERDRPRFIGRPTP